MKIPESGKYSSFCILRAIVASTVLVLLLPEVRGVDSATVVTKKAEDFSGKLWSPSQWNNVSGEVTKESDGASGKCLKAEVKFSASGEFEHFAIDPPKPVYLPGEARRVTMRVKHSDPRAGIQMVFKDGWGRGDNMQWSPALAQGTDWQTVSFEVPGDWVKPIAISEVVTHNYTFRGNKTDMTFWLSDIEVETDLAHVDAATGNLKTWKPDPNPSDKANSPKEVPATPLLSVGLSTPESANIFSTTGPLVALKIQNWNPGSLTGKASFTVTDQDGSVVKSWRQDLNVESSGNYEFPIEAKRYGLYTVKASVALTGGVTLDKQLTLARVPALPELTEQQKLESPYGLNYHGGGERLFGAFKKAGFIWYRDYAFGLESMRKAKGPDRRYAGWPYYPTILKDYQDLGLIVVPILHAIDPPELKDGKPVRLGPDLAWTRDIADILITFPSVHFWELSNEYDLLANHFEVERPLQWENYNLYHKKFAELAKILGGGQITVVENGRAGIYPLFEEAFLKSGAFADGGVINSHHYTGTQAPEINTDNFNMGSTLEDGRITGSFFDALRAVKRVAVSQGRKNQSWLTEFGWDTKAGPVVSTEQQAAYLQRGFLLAFAAGTDRAFWFYNFDAEKGVKFFDGCGLITYDHEPKLAFSAMAGLSSILPRPVYVGSINAGSNTAGYVFENDGKLIAGLWAIQGDSGPKVTFQAGQLFDYLGNPVEGRSAALKIAPVYDVGLTKSDPFYLQTAYSLESNQMIVVTAGDTTEAVVGIHNNRDQPISAQVKMALPKGWTAPRMDAAAGAAPGGRQEVRMPFTVGPDEPLGSKEILFTIEEASRPVKSFPLVVSVQPPIRLDVSALEGLPGKAAVNVQIENRSTAIQSGKLILKLPKGWESLTPEVVINDLKPSENRAQKVEIVWKPEWNAGESAKVIFQTAKGSAAQKAIIPNQYVLGKAGKITLDADLKDWPERLQLPEWIMGSTIGEANGKLWFGWTPEGLYGAVEVSHSKAQVQDPRSFWGGEVLELFISTKADKKDGSFGVGDHQFWIVPEFKDKKVYAGQWKVKDEIPSTRYDIAEVKGASRLTQDGYVMEFFIPAGVFQHYGLSAGGSIRLNANLTVHGPDFDRHVYWPRQNRDGLQTQPLMWGTLNLKD